MPEEFSLTVDDPSGQMPVEARTQAIAAAEAVLEQHGVTLEQCAQVGARAYPVRAVGANVNFFEGMGVAAVAWLEAAAAAQDVCGGRLQLVRAPSPRLN